MKNNECIHTVTVSRRLPKGIDPKLVFECTANPPDGEDVEVSLIGYDEIELTISLRGSLDYVENRADWLIDNGIAWARFVIEKPYR